MCHLQPTCCHPCAVCHAPRVYLCLALERSTTLGHVEGGGIVGAVGGDVALQPHAAGDAYLPCHCGREGLGDEVELVGLGLDLDVGAETVGVVEVAHKSVGTQVDHCGPRDVHAGEARLLHVAAHGHTDVDRMVGQTAQQRLGHQRRCATDDVATAKRGTQVYVHLAGMAAVKGVEVHIHAPLDAGVGGGEGEGGEVHRQRVDGYARGERGKAEPAFLGKCRAAHYRLDVWSAVEDRVYGQRQMAEGEVVVVEPLDGVYGAVVIAHAAVVEAEAAHAVEALVQVQIALARLESGNLCPYAQGVAGHVQG